MKQEKKVRSEKMPFLFTITTTRIQGHHPFILHTVLQTTDFVSLFSTLPDSLTPADNCTLSHVLAFSAPFSRVPAVHLASIALPMLISTQGNLGLYNHMGFYLSLSTVRTDKGLTKIPNFRISQPSLTTLSFRISIHELKDIGLLWIVLMLEYSADYLLVLHLTLEHSLCYFHIINQILTGYIYKPHTHQLTPFPTESAAERWNTLPDALGSCLFSPRWQHGPPPHPHPICLWAQEAAPRCSPCWVVRELVALRNPRGSTWLIQG